MKKIFILFTAILLAAVTGVSAKNGPTVGQHFSDQDTIIVRMKNGAKMILFLKNKEQLQAFQHYSLDSLMRVITKYVAQVDELEETTTDSGSKEMTVTFNPNEDDGTQGKEQITITVQDDSTRTGNIKKERHEIKINKKIKVEVEVEEDGDNTKVNVDFPSEDEGDEDNNYGETVKEYKATRSTFDIDLGLNTFVDSDLENLADLKPLGSRYVSLNWHINSQIGGRTSPLFLTSGLEFSFNNYMFEDQVIIEEIDNYTYFREVPELNLEKSKLTHSAVNVPLMPVLKFKRENGKDGFKIGAGGFAGYRLGSHSKIKYNEEGKTQKDKTRDSFNLSDFQYGLTGMVGYGGLDLFVKYNMNDLFKENRGPQANIISFGLRLFYD